MQTERHDPTRQKPTDEQSVKAQPVILALGWQRREDGKTEARLGQGVEGASGCFYVFTSKKQCLWKSELVVFKATLHPRLPRLPTNFLAEVQ